MEKNKLKKITIIIFAAIIPGASVIFLNNYSPTYVEYKEIIKEIGLFCIVGLFITVLIYKIKDSKKLNNT